LRDDSFAPSLILRSSIPMTLSQRTFSPMTQIGTNTFESASGVGRFTDEGRVASLVGGNILELLARQAKLMMPALRAAAEADNTQQLGSWKKEYHLAASHLFPRQASNAPSMTLYSIILCGKIASHHG